MFNISRRAHFLDKRQNPECPPCFNCQFPKDTCTNGGTCDLSGICECPPGWGKVHKKIN